jgi:hypothetical protein
VLLRRLRSDLRPTPGASGSGGSGGSGGSSRARGVRRELAAGFGHVWRRPVFRTTLAWSMCANLAINAVFVAAELRLLEAGFPAWQIGLVGTTVGACGVLGAVLAPWLIDRVPTGVLVVVVAWSFVPLLVPLALWNHPAVVCAAVAPGMLLNPAGNAGLTAYRISLTPPELVGRVQSVVQFVAWSTLPLAPVVGGALLALVGGPATVLALATACAVAALLPTCARSVRSLPRPSGWQEHWTRAGGGQRLPAGPQAGPQPDGPAGGALRAPGPAAGHP